MQKLGKVGSQFFCKHVSVHALQLATLAMLDNVRLAMTAAVPCMHLYLGMR